MALFNYATKEVTLKIVYYGPGLSGKTTNLQYLHSLIEPEKKGKLISLATEADRTLFFDFMPVELGKIKDFSIRFQLYTVPGQVRYNATRRLVLKGADAVVFVADSQRQMLQENIQSLQNMRENLIANNIDPDDIPVVMQYNKRDLPDILSTEELNQYLNQKGYPYFEAIAIQGKGVMETFREITKLLLKHISQKHKIDITEEEPSQLTKPQKQPETKKKVTSPITKPPQSVDTEIILAELRQAIKRIEDSAGNDKDILNAITQLKQEINDMKKAIEDQNKKYQQLADTVERINKAIESARTKKKWLFFS